MEAADGTALPADIERRLQSGTKSVTIDLSQLEFVSFGGIRAMLRLARSLKADQRSIDFLAGNQLVRDAPPQQVDRQSLRYRTIKSMHSRRPNGSSGWGGAR